MLEALLRNQIVFIPFANQTKEISDFYNSLVYENSLASENRLNVAIFTIDNLINEFYEFTRL